MYQHRKIINVYQPRSILNKRCGFGKNSARGGRMVLGRRIVPDDGKVNIALGDNAADMTGIT